MIFMSKFANLQTYSPPLYIPAIKHTNKQANKHVNKFIKRVNFERNCGAALVEVSPCTLIPHPQTAKLVC